MRSAFGVEHTEVSKIFKPKPKPIKLRRMLPESKAHHEVAGQIAQESGDHASAAWARKQQINQTKTRFANLWGRGQS